MLYELIERVSGIMSSLCGSGVGASNSKEYDHSYGVEPTPAAKRVGCAVTVALYMLTPVGVIGSLLVGAIATASATRIVNCIKGGSQEYDRSVVASY